MQRDPNDRHTVVTENKMSALLDACLTSIQYCCRNVTREVQTCSFFLHSQNLRHHHLGSLVLAAVPMFPVLHDCMDQLSWQKRSAMASAVWMREVERILSLLLNTSDWRVQGADSCVPVCSQLPSTALCGLQHIWDMGHNPTIGNKRASCFWSSAEGAILLVLGHQGSISLPSQERHPRAELSCPSEEGQCPNHAYQAPHRGLITPELAACYLLLQHPCMGS